MSVRCEWNGTVVRLRLIAVAGLALVVAGCGSVASPGSSPTGTPTSIGAPTQRSLATPLPSRTPVKPAGNVLTAADSGATVTLAVGQRLTVDLEPGPGAYTWDRPQVTGSGLMLVSVIGGYPDHGPMRAVYQASSPGTAVVSTVSDAPCLHQSPRCAISQRV